MNHLNHLKIERGVTMEYYFLNLRKAVSELLEKGWKIKALKGNKITATMEDDSYGK